MSKNEFLESLRSQLSGQMHEGKAAAHVQYYRNYIEEQMQKGRSEEEILAELGDPRLIAKTLCDTEAASPQEGLSDDGDFYYSEERRQQSYQENGRVKHHSYKLDLPTWYGKAIVILIAVLVIIGLVVVIGTVLPVLIIVSAILYVISRLRKRR